MSFDAGVCKLSISNQGTASAETEIPCDYAGDPIEIGFNASYLLEAIAAACPAGGAVSLAMSDPGSPATLTGAMENWLAVQMPMRV
jgi:DNA polymerase-3 subunit beta